VNGVATSYLPIILIKFYLKHLGRLLRDHKGGRDSGNELQWGRETGGPLLPLHEWGFSPAYTHNFSALPMISGLLAQGMSPAAALAFLIAGPTTTLPAMAAVWSLVSRRVFALYVSFVLMGAIIMGY
jgi:hypothetical protein